MATENTKQSISTKVWGRAGIDLTTHESAIGFVTDCDCRSRGSDIDILETFAHFSVKKSQLKGTYQGFSFLIANSF